MKILFPTDECVGLQAKRGACFKDAKFLTVITTNERGGVLSVEAIKKESNDLSDIQELQKIGANVMVLTTSQGKPLEKLHKIGIKTYVDDELSSVDNSLVKILSNHLFPRNISA
ncbi:MAG: hypothetical protein PHN38_09100 [Sulfurospirillaceae bacterium]|nr:hypothetical protein [Sulfurospirillaceae bacterium]